MILVKLKQFFINRGEASANEAAKALQIQLSAAEGMIAFLVKKNMLIACELGCSKSSCAGCPVRVKKYRWIG